LEDNKLLVLCVVTTLFLFLLACLIGLAFFNYTRFDAIFNLAGYYDRLTVYKIGMEAISSQYILGYGLGSTSFVIDNFRVYQQDYSIYFDDTQFGQMHNEPIQYFIEGGAFAFFSYIIFVVLLIRNFLFLICQTKLDEGAKAKIFALSISIAIGFLHSLVDIGIKSPFNRCYLYLLIGIFLSEVIYSKNNKS
jgi:O-antigen ligase